MRSPNEMRHDNGALKIHKQNSFKKNCDNIN